MSTQSTMKVNAELLKSYETALDELNRDTVERRAADRARTPIYQRQPSPTAADASHRALSDAAEALSAIWKNSPNSQRMRSRGHK